MQTRGAEGVRTRGEGDGDAEGGGSADGTGEIEVKFFQGRQEGDEGRIIGGGGGGGGGGMRVLQPVELGGVVIVFFVGRGGGCGCCR